jgi:hypothetical protein
MSTAHAHQLNPVEERRLFAENQGEAIRLLRTAAGIRPEQIWTALEISKGTWYNKLDSGHFTSWEMKKMAELFDCPLDALYQDADSLRRGLRTGSR